MIKSWTIANILDLFRNIILFIIMCSILSWLLCKYGNLKISDVLSLLGIILNIFALVFVAYLTHNAAIYSYEKIKEDRKNEYQDKLHLILREFSDKHRKIEKIFEFCKKTIEELERYKDDNREKVKIIDNFNNIIKNIEPRNRFEKYEKYNYIFIDEYNLLFRTNENAPLEKLDEDLNKFIDSINKVAEKINELYNFILCVENYCDGISSDYIKEKGMSISQIYEKLNVTVDEEKIINRIRNVVRVIEYYEEFVINLNSITQKVRKKYFFLQTKTYE